MTCLDSFVHCNHYRHKRMAQRDLIEKPLELRLVEAMIDNENKDPVILQTSL